MGNPTLSRRREPNVLLDRQIVANEVGLGLVAETRALESLDSRTSGETP